MNGWQSTPLADVLTEARSGFACGEDIEDGVFQVRMNNITVEGQIDLAKKRRVPRNYRGIDNFVVDRGDVLFNATNSPDLVGKTAYFPGLNEPAVFSNHFIRLRPNRGRLEGRYLARWLNLQFDRGIFKRMCRQWVNQATVNRDALLSLKIPVPSLIEQQRIADILDKADALRAKRRAAFAQLDTLTQSIFLDMFGDPATNPNGWPIVRLGEKSDLLTGYPFRSDVYVANEDSIRLCRGANILPGRIDWSDLARWPLSNSAQFAEFSLRPGDVLIAMDRPWISEGFKIAQVRKEDCPALLVQRVARLRAKGQTPSEYICSDSPHLHVIADPPRRQFRTYRLTIFVRSLFLRLPSKHNIFLLRERELWNE